MDFKIENITNCLVEKYNKKNVDYLSKLSKDQFFSLFPDWEKKNVESTVENPYYKYGIQYYKYIQEFLHEIIKHKYALPVKYTFGINSKNLGRLYGNRMCIQRCCREVRKFLTADILKDYDIKSCHPNIMRYLCKKHNLRCVNLDDYCQNREIFLAQNNISKQDILKFFNCDKVKKNSLTTQVKSLIDEMAENKIKIKEIYKENFQLSSDEDKKNPISSVVNRIWCQIENYVLHDAINSGVIDKSQVSVLMYDGFMSTENISEETLKNLNNFSNTILWEQKDNSSTINIDDSELPECEKEIEIKFYDITRVIKQKVKERDLFIDGDFIYTRDLDYPMKVNKLPSKYYHNDFLKKDEFVNSIFQEINDKNYDNGDLIKLKYEDWIVDHPTAKKSLLESLNDAYSYRQLIYNKNVISFKNGYLKLFELTFHSYERGKNYLPSRVHFDIEFRNELLNKSWTEIDNGYLQSAIDYQLSSSIEKEIQQVLYGSIGRLFFDTNQYDQFMYMVVLNGAAGTMKSTVGEIIEHLHKKVMSLSATDIGSRFALQNLNQNPDVIFDPDVGSDFVQTFGIDKFKKHLNGESYEYGVKNKPNSISTSKQGIFVMGNNLNIKDPSNALSDRIAMIYFRKRPTQEMIKNKPKHLNILNENLKIIDAIIVKSVKAYKSLIEKYGPTLQFRFWDDLEYFNEQRIISSEDNSNVSSYFNHSLCSFKKTGTNTIVELQKIKEEWKNIIRFKFPTQDSIEWDVANLSVKRLNSCTICKKVRTDKYISLEKCVCEKKSHETRMKTPYIVGISEKEAVNLFLENDLG